MLERYAKFTRPYEVSDDLESVAQPSLVKLSALDLRWNQAPKCVVDLALGFACYREELFIPIHLDEGGR